MKYLGIDYGKTKMGTAYSEGEMASPGEVISISGLKDALEKIKVIISKKEIENVVIGIPESGEARQITEKFIQALKHDMLGGIQIIEVEETLSTQIAQESMLSLGVSKKKRSKEDAYAAAEILQEYLDADA